MTVKTLAFVRSSFLLILLAAAILVILKPSLIAGGVLVLVGIALWFTITWHARKTVYQCQRCQHKFKITPWTDFTSPHTGNSKWLKCPSCEDASWCEVVDFDPDETTGVA